MFSSCRRAPEPSPPAGERATSVSYRAARTTPTASPSWYATVMASASGGWRMAPPGC